MAGDDEVLIKIAADVAAANAAILSVGTTLDASLGAANETASATTAIVQILTAGFESLGTILGIVSQNVGEMNVGMQTVVGVFEGMAAGAKEAEEGAKGAAEGVSGVGKEVEEVSKKTKRLTEEAVTWGTLMADAIKNISHNAGEAIKAFPAMVAGQAAAGEQLNMLANRLDLTAEATRELQFVSDLSGVNMNVMAKATQTLSAQLQDVDSKASKAVKSIGLFPEELNKLSKTEAMSKIVEQIRQLPPGIDKSAKMIEIFGAKASQMTGLLKEDLPQIHDEFSKLVDEKAIADSARLGNEFGGAMTKIQLVMEETKRSMSNAVLPAVNAVLEALPGLGGAALLAGQSLYKVGESMAPMVSNFALAQIQQKGFTVAMNEFGGSLSKIGPLMSDFGGQLLKMGKFLLTNPWGILITAAAILLPMLWEMVGGWEGISKAIEPVITYFEDMYTIGKELAEMFLGDLVTGLGDLVGWFDHFFTSTDQGMGTLNGLITWAKSWIDWLHQFPIVGQYIDSIRLQLELVAAVAKKLWEWTTKFGSAIADFFKRVGKEAHDTAEGIRSLDAATAAATKQLEDQKKAKEDAAKGTKEQLSNMDRMKAKVDYLNSAYASLDETQKASIKSMAAAGMSTKEIAEDMKSSIYHGIMSVDDVGKVVDRFKDKMKEAEQAAKKNPWLKLLQDAKELKTAMDAAANSPLIAQIEEFGKKADEIATKAAMRGELDKIDKSIVNMAESWNKAQLTEKVKATTKASEELAKAFQTKITEASLAATTAITAMQSTITESQLTGSEQRLFAIDKEKNAQLAAVDETSRKLDEDLKHRSEKELEIVATRIKNEQETLGLGRELSEARKNEIRGEVKVVLDAEQAKTEAVKASLADQKALIKMHAEWRVALEKWATGEFEIDAKAAGLVTAKANAEELERQKRKLELMKDARSGYSKWEIDEQQRSIDQMDNEFEASAKRRGQATAKSANDQLKTETDKLADMERANSGYNRVQIAAQREVVEGAKKSAGIIKVDWAGALDSMTQAFAQLAQISGGTFGGIMKSVGEVTGSFNVMSKGLSSVFGKDGVFSKDKGGFGAIGQAFTKAKDGAGGLGGLIKGIGGSIPMIGMAIQGVMAAATAAIAIGKKMWDAFTKTPGEKMAKELERDFKNAAGKALKVSEEFGNKIAKTAADMFKGDRFAAGIYHLQDVIKEAGGLSEKNFSEMSSKLRDVFSLVQKGTFTTEQATKVLDENFGAFAKHVTDSGKVASKEFTDLLRLNGEFGTQSKEIINFVSQQATKLGLAFQKQVAPIKKASEDIAGEITKLKDAAAEPVDQADTKAVEARNKTLQQLEMMKVKQAELAKTSMPAVERSARLMNASFNAAVKDGVGMVEAIDQLGPGLDDILSTMKNLGVDVKDTSVAWIAGFRDRVNANKELVDSTGSLNEIMLAMSNIGALNEETFKDLQDQGTQSFEQLKAAGFSEQESLTMLKGFLEQTRNAHKELGLPIDENTAKLIAQAEAQGVLKEEQLSTNDIMLQGLGAIIEAVGGKIPEAWKKAGEAAVDTAKKVSETVDDTVNATIEDQQKALQDAEDAWKEEAREAERAALAMKKSVEKVDKSVDGVSDALDDTDWEGWASDAVSAAGDVQGAVDGVSLGHSPGGLKEIPLKLKAAQDAFKIWERTGVTSASSVQDAIDAMHGRDLGMAGIRSAGVPQQMPTGEFVRQVTGDASETSNAPVNLTFNITSMDPAGVELVTERKILPAMVKILRRGRNLADMQTVLNLKG